MSLTFRELLPVSYTVSCVAVNSRYPYVQCSHLLVASCYLFSNCFWVLGMKQFLFEFSVLTFSNILWEFVVKLLTSVLLYVFSFGLQFLTFEYILPFCIVSFLGSCSFPVCWYSVCLLKVESSLACWNRFPSAVKCKVLFFINSFTPCGTKSLLPSIFDLARS
jgi:hypothetical protein